MKNIRIIARLDVKGEHLVKGIELEGLRKVGNPNEYGYRYYQDGIDEIIYMDIVASLYNRNSLLEILKNASRNIFIPMTVGGGIRTLDDARKALKSGADKVAVNTAIINNPELINQISNEFGSQCMVVSIEAKNLQQNTWEVYYDNGREKTGIDVSDWVDEVTKRGAGEILLTSVDKEGRSEGMDINLLSNISSMVNIPVIASGGAGTVSHIKEVVKNTNVSAIALAKILHYNILSVQKIKNELKDIEGIEIR